MKFLIDAQLPALLKEILLSLGFEAMHVEELPNGDETNDKEIAQYADNEGWIVVTKDADFYHAHMIHSQPSKLLLITTGNIKNRALFDMIRAHALTFRNLFETCDYVELTLESVIAHKS